MNPRSNPSRNTQDTLNDYKKRMKEDLKSLKENFLRIVEAARYEERSQLSKTTASLYDTSQVQVRAAKIVLAGENLMKLIAELKTFLVIYDFPAINENLKKRNSALDEETKKIKSNLLTIREELGDQLYPGEDEYYSTLRPLKSTVYSQQENEPENFIQNGHGRNLPQPMQNYVQIVDDPMYTRQNP